MARFCAATTDTGGVVAIGVDPVVGVIAGANVSAVPPAAKDADGYTCASCGAVVCVGKAPSGYGPDGVPDC